MASARSLHAVCARSIAILRPEQTLLAGLLLAEGLEVVFCAEARAGMGHSLAAGVAASPDARAWVVALADMPFIHSATIARVARAMQLGALLAAPFLDGRRGHPVGFAARWREDLLALEGDEGARGLLVTERERLLRVETDDVGVLRDVDRVEDLR